MAGRAAMTTAGGCRASAGVPGYLPSWIALCAGAVFSLVSSSPGPRGQAVAGELTASSRRAVGAVVGDRHVADSAFEVHRRALALAPADRYEFLADWVLPGESHDTFRVMVDFTPTHPAPPVGERNAAAAEGVESVRRSGKRRAEAGGELIAPALDLIAVARELGRLEPLRQRVALAAASDRRAQRAKLSLLALIDIELSNFEAALRHLDALYPLIEAHSEHHQVARSAELLAIQGAMRHSPTRGFARDAASHLVVRGVRISGRGPAVAWETHLMAMLAALRDLDDEAVGKVDQAQPAADLSRGPALPAGENAELTEWQPASRATAASRGAGHAPARWRRVGDRVENVSSHAVDYLYYHVPLQGSFQVECDLKTKDYQNTQLVVGGQWAESLYYSRDKYDYGNLRERLGRGDARPALTKARDSTHMRATVQDASVTLFANGRLLHRVEVAGEVDPWIMLRSDSRQDGSVTDVRITGNPTIPRELRLTASEDLAGWYSYFGGDVGKPNAVWQFLGDLAGGGGIVGRRRPDLGGMHAEQLISYHRPMFEDGTIEYEFFYRERESSVHPALDRLAFLLEPDGVRIHWITDGVHERSGIAPDNVTDEPAQRRGPVRLPLAQDAWNRLRLDLAGDTVSLYLNDERIYERALEITNQRTFGLFHFADRTGVQVRNVRWRGAWPEKLPVVARQELASRAVQVLEDRESALTAVWEHDFAREGLSSGTMAFSATAGGRVEQTEEGIRIDRPGASGYPTTDSSPHVVIGGDFDVIAAYRRFDANPEPGAVGTLGLRVVASEAMPQQCLLLRRFLRGSKEEDRHLVQAVFRRGPVGAELDWNTLYSDADESDAGRLRLARRGKRLYYLTAEGESPNFRLLAETEVPSDDLPARSIHLFVQHAGQGEVSVLWKSLLIRAERLAIRPSPGTVVEQTLSVMNHDGTGLRRLLPKGSPIVGPGSPAWSPDGKQIAFDVYNGSTANSRMYLINSDGSNLRDLGIGNMPAFSPDGKRLVFSWDGNRVAVLDLDGASREVVDPSGWGAQWSSDGRIAFARGGNVVVHDLATRRQREILEGEHAARYANVYWNSGWSRDGRYICFKARTRRDNKYEIAVVAAAGSRHEFQVLYASPQQMTADFCWHPDGHRILFPMRVGNSSRLFVLDRRRPGPPELLPGQPRNHSITGADWSADGQQIVFTSQVLSE